MSRTPTAGVEALPVPLARRVHAVCTAFEDAWRAAVAGAGPRPRPEDHLGDVSGPARDALLVELVALDAHYRRRAGESPRADEYAARFPGLDPAAVADVVGADGPGPGDAPEPTPDRGRPDRPCDGNGPGHLPADPTDPSVPRLGRFELVEPVGSGGFAEVWRARDPVLCREVALKVLHPGLVASPPDRERFLREAQAAAQLRHPNIVVVHEIQEVGGRPAIVADFVTGVPLADALGCRPADPRWAAELAAAVADALDYAHAMGVIHRDVKPANILLDRGGGPAGPGRPVLADFGLARWAEAGTGLTAEGHVLGTPAYMSPEQAAGGASRADRRTDVYALGAVLYELLTGRRPFDGPWDQVLEQVLRADPIPPRRANRSVPRDLEAVCVRAMAKDPDRRYQTAREMADDLRRFLAGEPVKARPARAWARAAKWARRRPAAAALAAVVGLLGTVGFPGAVWLWQRAEGALAREADARRDEEAARIATAEERAKAEANLASKLIALAHRQWLAVDVEAARRTLAECPPEYRDREWHYLHRACHAERRTIPAHDTAVTQVVYSPDGGRLASANPTGHVRVWDAATGQRLREFPINLPGRDCFGLTFSPDGATLTAAARPSMTTRLIVRASPPTERSRLGSIGWAVGPGEERFRHAFPETSAVVPVALSPDGDRLAAARGTEVVVWGAASGTELFRLAGPVPLRDLAFSTDGGRLAVLGKDSTTILVWDLATRQVAATVRTPEPVNVTRGEFALGPGGRHLAWVVRGSTPAERHAPKVTLWDVGADREIATLAGDTGLTGALTFSPDGRHIATSTDKAVRLWHLTTGREALVLRGHQGRAMHLAFRPDGRRLASAGSDGTVRVWDVDGPADPPPTPTPPATP